MWRRHSRPLLVGALCSVLLASAAAAAQDVGTSFERRYRENVWRAQQGRDGRRGPRTFRGYQDPAFARGYSDGWEKGLDDGRDRDRYDPVRHGDYRDADEGYSRAYGSKDAYKSNYRSGFRQGYDDGYRDGVRWRR